MASIFDAEGFWPAIVGIVLFGGWIIPVVAGVLAKNWRKARESEHLAVLKQSMIERGMSVEEMERVINLGKHLESHLRRDRITRDHFVLIMFNEVMQALGWRTLDSR